MPSDSVFNYSDIEKGLVSVEIKNFNSPYFDFEIYDSAGRFGNGKVTIKLLDELSTETNILSVIIKAGVVGTEPALLNGITEIINYKNNILISHDVNYQGIKYDYPNVDSLITTVTRNGNFTNEFATEIDNYLGYKSNLTYDAAVKLIGIKNIESVIIFLAGSDGDYIN